MLYFPAKTQDALDRLGEQAGVPQGPAALRSFIEICPDAAPPRIVLAGFLIEEERLALLEEISEELASGFAEDLGDNAYDPDVYEGPALSDEADIVQRFGPGATPGLLRPYQMLNDFQRQATYEVEEDTLDQITANAADCEPLLR